MNSVINLMIERFPNIYHAQIFLVDSESRYAILRASTGEAGAQLLARGHRLAVGSISLVGQATGQKRALIARDTAQNPLHKQQQFLPETRAELAVPLLFGDQIIGALDVQSTQRDAFDPEQTEVLQTVANQIAVAIQTAQLYEESIRRLEQINANNRQATLRAWQDYVRSQRKHELTSEVGLHIERSLSVLRRAAMTSGQVVVGEMTENQTTPVAIPIQISGQVLGAVEWEIPSSDFTDEKLELARELASRLAVGLENARLFQESQRAAERERLVNSIAARLTAQTDIHDILQTAVREVGQALRTPQVSIHLRGLETADQNRNGNHES
jgi:GAF domain-containing protein